jgi:hypothetical protein
MAEPYADDKPAYPRSFAALIADSAGFNSSQDRARIAWLRTPRDGSDTFLTISAETLLRPAGDPDAQVLRAGLKDKIVLVGVHAARDRHPSDAADRSPRGEDAWRRRTRTWWRRWWILRTGTP